MTPYEKHIKIDNRRKRMLYEGCNVKVISERPQGWKFGTIGVVDKIEQNTCYRVNRGTHSGWNLALDLCVAEMYNFYINNSAAILLHKRVLLHIDKIRQSIRRGRIKFMHWYK